jgi:hypothetical protein
MRQPPPLRWIEQAEARKAAAEYYERAPSTVLQGDAKNRPKPARRRVRLWRPLLYRLSMTRAADRS